MGAERNEPGGERQDPRVDIARRVLRDWRGEGRGDEAGWNVDPDAIAAALVAASSIPVGGAPRDDQNDAGETLANTRGLFQEIRREIAISGRELEGEALAKWMDQRWPQFAEPGALSAALTKSSSGAAPKGEREKVDESSASWQNGYEVGFEHAKVASPPPDRLTDLEHEATRAAFHLREATGLIDTDDVAAWKHVQMAYDRLRLADREPE